MKELLQELNANIKSFNNAVMTLIEFVKGGGVAIAANSVPCSFTLHTWLDEWYRTYKTPNVKPNTLGTIEVAIRVHIKPKLPNTALNLITGLQLQDFFISMEQSRTRKLVYDVLNSSFKEAQSLKLIQENPMQAVKIPKHVREKGACLDKPEIKKFLAAIKGHALENYFKFLLYTGCRRNEGLNLCKNDVDFKKKLIHIRGTKTETSNRTIPLFENAAVLLSSIEPQADGLYFPFRPDYPTHAFKKNCPNHKLHDLRHTFATRCLEAKIPLKVVQTWLGHSEIDTTANIYSHVTSDFNAAEARAFDKYLANKK